MKADQKKIEDAGVCQGLILRTVQELSRASELIASLSDGVYESGSDSGGSTGAHVRHNLDVIGCFLRGFESGRIDYSARTRDHRIETDRDYALERIGRAISSLAGLGDERTSRKLEIRSEIDGNVWHISTAGRELEFLHSHTVHHHALIAQRLGSMGIRVAREFGVAPSTLDYWKSTAAPGSHTGSK